MKADKETSTDDEIQRGVKLKEKKLSRLKCLKSGLRGWTPKVDLFYIVGGGMKRKPVVIGDRDEDAHISFVNEVYRMIVSPRGDTSYPMEAPRLWRGGSRSLTFAESIQETPDREPPSTRGGDLGWTNTKV